MQHMQVEVERKGDKSKTRFDRPKKYTLHFGAFRKEGYIGFGFSTDGELKRSRFDGAFGPKDFESFIRLMIEADQEATVKAIAAALQDVRLDNSERDFAT